MIGKRWLIGAVVTVPMVAFLAAQGLREYTARSAAVTLGDICDGAQPGLAVACGDYTSLGYLRATAGAAGVVGVGLLLGIRLAGSIAGRNRSVLLNAFKPGLYVTALAVIALIAVHGGLAVVTLFYAEIMLTGGIHLALIMVIGVCALAGVVAVARGTFAVVHAAEVTVLGTRIDRAQGRRIYQRVEALAQALGALRPQHVVVGLDPNFFVTEASVRCLNGVLTGRTLYCSLPLARILSLAEFDAVIGHELGHFRGQDTEFSQKFYPIYRGTADSLRALRDTGVGGAALLPLLPAVGVMSHFYDAFALAERQHGRVREMAADRDGARLSGTEAMASALVKVHAFAGAFDHVCQATLGKMNGGESFANVSKMFSQVVAQHATRDAVRSVGAMRTTHPTDSHPPLNVRLEALGMPLKKVEEQALQVAPGTPAISLIDGAEAIEQELSEVFQAMLARHAAAAAKQES